MQIKPQIKQEDMIFINCLVEIRPPKKFSVGISILIYIVTSPIKGVLGISKKEITTASMA
jgi:hypothetical protein